MVQKIKLSANQLPQKMAELIHSNQFLKLFSLISLAVLILAFATIILMTTRAPAVIAFDMTANTLEAQKLPDVKLLIERAVVEYIKHRYDWTPNNVNQKLDKARSFINGSHESAFTQATRKVADFSHDKKVIQRAFPTDIQIDLKNQTAKVVGERVTSIMGIRAAGELKVELHFTSGPHTKANPWGVYISKEVELL